ncbi:DDRGK domain-containing protein 1 [Eumeta japonica]|uniref:DDRGK domain-containing protein 1 n=1 Tax=Eumeta variegata TaxID=151549 RepID=A0A4C1V891_EUMVA|nr:DDRGK domain-containing protein 1 [Eumeta japonica]
MEFYYSAIGLLNVFLAGARPKAVAPRDGGQGRVQAVRNQRARLRANAARTQAALLEEEVPAAEEAEEDAVPTTTQKVDFDDKMGAKKRAKLEAKLEKKKAREAEEQMREQRRKKEQVIEEERKKVEEQEEGRTGLEGLRWHYEFKDPQKPSVKGPRRLGPGWQMPPRLHDQSDTVDYHNMICP